MGLLHRISSGEAGPSTRKLCKLNALSPFCVANSDAEVFSKDYCNRKLGGLIATVSFDHLIGSVEVNGYVCHSFLSTIIERMT